MIDEVLPDESDPEGQMAVIKRTAIEAADAIICISESTRRDLQARFKIPDSRIVLTHLASSLTTPISPDKKELPNQPYILFVGSRATYKNFIRLLVAFSRARSVWKDLVLCVCGSNFTATENQLISALNIANAIHHCGNASDDKLCNLYYHSEALVYPSLYEGFGIPPLEAMSCGTVVITTNRSSLPEVVGNAAIIVDPESADSIADAILHLRELGSKRSILIQAGNAQALKFSWKKTAETTVALYRSLS